MIARAWVLVVAGLTGTAGTAVAQPKERLPIAVVDLRAASVGLPTVAGWTPPVQEGTLVPSRSFGFDAGAHVYIWRGRRVALGIGAGAVMASGTTSPPETATGSQLLPAPEVTTRLTSLAPQLSINFGHRFGWSYLSGGVGRGRVRAEVSRAATITAPTMVEIGWVQTINYGGGARWFINDHVALNLDLRWHKLPSVAATTARPAAERASLIVAGGGISIK
jgi:hypothetical protein